MTIVKSGRGAAQWLKAEVVKGKLVISVGVDVLAFAAQRHMDEQHFEATEGRENQADDVITDPVGFAVDVCRELMREDDVGGHLIGKVLDDAFDAAIHRGSTALSDRAECNTVLHGPREP